MAAVGAAPWVKRMGVDVPRQTNSHYYYQYPTDSTRRRVISSLLLMILIFCTLTGLNSAVTTFWRFSGDRPDSRGRLGLDLAPGSHQDSLSTSRHLWTKKQTDLRKLLLETPTAEKIAESSNYYAAGPHLAGKNRSQAEWTRDLWRSYGVESELVSYDVYINYPDSHRLALLKQRKKGKDPKVVYECSIEEDVLEEDPTTSLPNRVPAFHGYSASGNVTAQYVYVNFGTVDDYKDVKKAGVKLEGKIAIVKYGRNFRGIKVQLAQDYGMVGVVIYDDPQQDGNITELNGYKHYPEGPARNPSSLQRGSVQFLSTAPGDPTTIGYPSKPGAPRGDPRGTIPRIPSLPISYKDALPLLKALNGHGPGSKDFNEYWQGGGLEHLGVKYNVGPTPKTLQLNLVNNVEYTTTPLWDVIGIINGTKNADQSVIIGNHRDAWIAGGAADPNSGSSVLNEVIRGYGKALDSGWRPQRTMVFASWDGEEYGLLGSTEWVEEYVPWIKAEALSYLNVDTAASGPVFSGDASPLKDHALRIATSLVKSPNQTISGQTILDVWKAKDGEARISTLGSGSDYTAFIDFAGVSSINLGFRPDANSPVYHYHSNYDSSHWMQKYGDPGFRYHVAVAQLMGVLAADMVETPVIPFIASDYANGLASYVETAAAKLHGSSQGRDNRVDDKSEKDLEAGFERLRAAVRDVQAAAEQLDDAAERVMAELQDAPWWWRWLHGRSLQRRARRINGAFKQFEQVFLYEGGLDGRPWFKHVIFAPGKTTGYAGVTLPGLSEALSATPPNVSAAARWQRIIEHSLEAAHKALKDGAA